ncbi:HAD family hydrolase [Hansschlegelia zhihuaiae]|uniref:phosphoserine phosphatase n=1 Tax=Hansschlegelia zhihuaiae TaxID=405005 RepID=A0A4Q0MNS6_9HYPH|nr:HAD-IB family phosphatase [Hansschlegelia zhihuaiae]RXF75303.1 HAD family hydrolase [Hansschlegelia zhihuaiae]
MKLLVFDMDGVVFRGANFWLEFHHRMGTAEAALDLWRRFGASDYTRLGELTAALWKGRPSAEYFRMIDRRTYFDGVRELIAHAKRSSYRTAIITSGAWHLARRAHEELGVDAFRANRLGVGDDGAFDGTVRVEVDDNYKDRALEKVQAELGIDRRGTVVVGDTKSDLQMASLAGTSIGFQVRDEAARDLFGHVVEGRSLKPAISLISEAG